MKNSGFVTVLVPVEVMTSLERVRTLLFQLGRTPNVPSKREALRLVIQTAEEVLARDLQEVDQTSKA